MNAASVKGLIILFEESLKIAVQNLQDLEETTFVTFAL